MPIRLPSSGAANAPPVALVRGSDSRRSPAQVPTPDARFVDHDMAMVGPSDPLAAPLTRRTPVRILQLTAYSGAFASSESRHCRKPATAMANPRADHG